MSWITPTETWTDSRTPQPSDFNRIEGNTDYLKDSVDNNDSDILSNASSIASVETAVSNNDSDIASSGASITVLNGTGTPQGVGTTSSPVFNDIQMTRGSHIVGGSISAATIAGYFDADDEIRMASGWVEWGHTGPAQGDTFYSINAVKRLSATTVGLSVAYSIKTDYGSTDAVDPAVDSSESWYTASAYKCNIILGPKI